MTETSEATSVGPVERPDQSVKATGWVGWVVFAALMMITIGTFQAIMGFVALFRNDYYLVTKDGLMVPVDYTTWGWIHIVLGALAVLAGFAIMAGRMWGRVVGIVLAVLNAITNVIFLAAYPLWSVIVITIDVIVIYALAVHGREMRAYTD